MGIVFQKSGQYHHHSSLVKEKRKESHETRLNSSVFKERCCSLWDEII